MLQKMRQDCCKTYIEHQQCLQIMNLNLRMPNLPIKTFLQAIQLMPGHIRQAPGEKGTSFSKIQTSHQEIDYLFEKNWSEEQKSHRQQWPMLRLRGSWVIDGSATLKFQKVRQFAYQRARKVMNTLRHIIGNNECSKVTKG